MTYPNKFAAPCHRCGGHVAAQEGRAEHIDGRWAVRYYRRATRDEALALQARVHRDDAVIPEIEAVAS